MSNYRPLVIVNGVVQQLSDSDTLYVASFSIGGFVLAAPTSAAQLYRATGANAASWTTDITGLTTLGVDSITIDDNNIASSTGVVDVASFMRVGDGTHVYSDVILSVVDDVTSSISSVFGVRLGGTLTASGGGHHAYGSLLEPTMTVANGCYTHGVKIHNTTNADVGVTIPAAYGGYIQNNSKTGTGTITNSFGLYLEAQTAGADNWTVYALGTSYFTDLNIGGWAIDGPTAADQVMVSSASNVTSWQAVPDCWAITSTQISNWDTAYGWGDHDGLYDAIGSATTAVTTHESSYFHTTGPTADNQILQATGAGTAAWTTDVQTLTSLAVDSLTLDNNVIASSGGVYVFSTSGNLVLRAQTSGSIYIDTASKLWVREEGSYTTRFTVSAVDGSVGIGSDNLSNTGVYMNVWTSGSGIASQFLVTGRAYSSDGAAYSLRVATQAYPANGQQARQVNVEGSLRVDAGNTIPWLIGMMINPIPKSGDGTVTNAASLYVYPQTIGVTNYAIIVTGGVSRFNDSAVLAFGNGLDATLTYNGTDFILDPDAVGSGHFKINGATDIVGGLTVDGVSVSGTIQIGSSDVCRVLSENKTYYVRTTGNDTTGDGSSGTPWLTVGRALDEIYKWIADENTITIDVGEGTFAESTLSPTYAYGSNLYVTGVSETHTSGCAVSSIGSITALESGLEYIDFTITLPAGYTTSVGDYIACKTASGGTNEHLTLGVHEVIGWNSGTRAATVRCVRRAGVTAVPSGAISLTDIRVIKTVLAFASGHGINMVGAYHGGNWDALVLTGNSSGYALNLTNGASIVASSSFATSDWNNTIYCAGNGNFFGDSTCHSFCRGSLIRVQNGGVAQIRYGTVLTGAKTTGIFCFVGATVAAYRVQMATCGNADGVLCYQGGFVDVSSGYVRDGNPTGNGCNANRGGGIDATSATISGYATSTATATNGYIIGP